MISRAGLDNSKEITLSKVRHTDGLAQNQGSYPFLNKKFMDFSRTFKDTFPIFQGLYSIKKEPKFYVFF